jgi:hypothetical protein
MAYVVSLGAKWKVKKGFLTRKPDNAALDEANAGPITR